MRLDNNTFEQLVNDACDKIIEHHLYEAFTIFNALKDNVKDEGIIPTVESMQRYYENYLNSWRSGNVERRDDSYIKALEIELLNLLYTISKAHRIQLSTDVFGEEGKIYYTLLKENQTGITDIRDNIFRRLWITNVKATELTEIFEKSNKGERLFYISALTLSLLEYFDENKIHFLIGYCHTADKAARVRCIIGIVFACMAHDKVFALFPHIIAELRQLIGDRENAEIIFNIQAQFYILKESDNIQKEIHQKIIPEIHETLRNRRLDFFFNNDEEASNIEEIIYEKGLSSEQLKAKEKTERNIKRLKQMSGMGFDINKGVFRIAHSLPFFQNPSHWLLTYDAQNEGLAQNQDSKDSETSYLQNIITTNSDICDTDKYAFCLLLDKVIGSELKRKMEEFNEKLSASEKQKLADEIVIKELSIKDICRNDMQCLSRLFNESKWKNKFRFNPFCQEKDFIDLKSISTALTSNEIYLTKIAEELTTLRQAKQALKYWDVLIKNFNANANVFKKRGLCLQAEALYDKAIEEYRNALILEQDNLWISNQMQQCYAHLGKYDNQLQILLQLEAAQPDNPKFQIEIGLCLMKLSRWKEAAQRFYRLEFENIKVAQAIRAIAWCELMQNNLDRAGRYYNKIIYTQDAHWEDYLNAGHLAFIKNDFDGALTLYKKYVSQYLCENHSATDALNPYDTDKKTLLELGKTEFEIAIMYDCIRKSLNEKD